MEWHFIQEDLDTVLEKYLDWIVPIIKEAIEMQALLPESLFFLKNNIGLN